MPQEHERHRRRLDPESDPFAEGRTIFDAYSRFLESIEKTEVDENPPYPEHLRHPTRIAVATQTIIHEDKKLGHLSTPQDEKRFIYERIGSILQRKEDVRDFWNLIYGRVGGYMLKINPEYSLVDLFSAQNIRWYEKDVDVNSVHFLAHVDDPNTPYVTGEDMKNFLQKSGRMEEIRKESELCYPSDDIQRDEDRVIVLQEYEKDKQLVIDGNGRVKRAVIKGIDRIPAFVGQHIDNQPPHNYWVPTSYIMEICKLAAKNPKLEDHATAILFDYFTNSQSSLIEFSTITARHIDERFRKKVLDKWSKTEESPSL